MEPFEVDAKYLRLCKIVLGADLSVLSAICSEIPQDVADDVAQSLVILFNAANQMDTLIRWAIKKEIARTIEVDDMNGLFRNNFVHVKIIAEYIKSVGDSLLAAVLRKPLKKILEIKAILEVNMNKSRDLTVQNMKKNFEKLLSLVDLVLESIIKSTALYPKAFFELFSILANEISKVYPDKIDIAIGGFIFLRFFCPALVSPEGFNLVKTPVTPEARKNLILISKTLQNMASGVEFGENEPYMLNANQFLRDSKGFVHAYLQSLAIFPADSASILYFGALPESVVTDAMSTLHYHIKLLLPKITASLQANGHKQPDVLAKCINELGEPAKPSKAVALRAAMHEALRKQLEDLESTKKERKGVFNLKRAVLLELVQKGEDKGQGEKELVDAKALSSSPSDSSDGWTKDRPFRGLPEISFDELERRLGLINRDYETVVRHNAADTSVSSSPPLSPRLGPSEPLLSPTALGAANTNGDSWLRSKSNISHPLESSSARSKSTENLAAAQGPIPVASLPPKPTFVRPLRDLPLNAPKPIHGAFSSSLSSLNTTSSDTPVKPPSMPVPGAPGGSNLASTQSNSLSSLATEDTPLGRGEVKPPLPPRPQQALIDSVLSALSDDDPSSRTPAHLRKVSLDTPSSTAKSAGEPEHRLLSKSVSAGTQPAWRTKSPVTPPNAVLAERDEGSGAAVEKPSVLSLSSAFEPGVARKRQNLLLKRQASDGSNTTAEGGPASKLADMSPKFGSPITSMEEEPQAPMPAEQPAVAAVESALESSGSSTELDGAPAEPASGNPSGPSAAPSLFFENPGESDDSAPSQPSPLLSQLDKDVQEMKKWCGKVATKLSSLHGTLQVSSKVALEIGQLQKDSAELKERVASLESTTRQLQQSPSASVPEHHGSFGGSGSASSSGQPDELSLLRVHVSRLERFLTDERKARVELQQSMTQLKTEMDLIKRRLT